MPLPLYLPWSLPWRSSWPLGPVLWWMLKVWYESLCSVFFFRCILFVTSQNMWLGLKPKETRKGSCIWKVRIGNGREDLFEVLSFCFLIPLHSKGTFCKEITPTCQHHGILGWSSWTKLPFFKRSDTTTMHHHPDFFQIKLLLDLQKSLENKGFSFSSPNNMGCNCCP